MQCPGATKTGVFKLTITRRGPVIAHVIPLTTHHIQVKQMKLNRIDIVSIPVKDQQSAKVFYTEVLGFSVTRDNPMGPEQRWIELVLEGAETSITLVTWFDSMPPGSVQGLVLDTDDLLTAHSQLKSKGLDISDVEDAPWGRYATFKDPDGNGWVLQQTPTAT